MFASPPSAVAASLALMTVRVPPDGNEPVEMLQPPRSAAASAKKKERVEREIIEGTSERLTMASFTVRAAKANAVLVSRDCYRFIVSSRSKGAIAPDAGVAVVETQASLRATEDPRSRLG
jgi:hypothetical protein